MSTPEKTKRVMPKGGRKGGAVFPRLSLQEALGYSAKLVSKSHTGRISKDILYSGVLGAKSGRGDIRASALKQYALMVGDRKGGFSASDLAKKIASSPTEELSPLHRQAALSPAVFKKIFDTFHGDPVTRAKLKQRAADLLVHPDETETCIDLYVRSLDFSGLVTVDGDKVTHAASSSVVTNPKSPNEQLDSRQETEDGELENGVEGTDDSEEAEKSSEGHEEASEKMDVEHKPLSRSKAPKAVITINVSLDSTTDSDKLARQLALLRKYGAI